MKNFYELKQTKVFSSATEFDIQAMMFCFKAKFKTYEKHQEIVKQGDEIEDLILILKGGAKVENVDILGNISIVLKLEAGDIFGIESAYAGYKYHNDSLITTEKSLVLFLNKHRTITPCHNRCKRHDFVVKNLMQLIAERNVELLEKLKHISKKSTREKLLSYLYTESKIQGSSYFDIPFSKTELANYLSVDRSAMSNELSKMKSERLIDFDKRKFRIIKTKQK